MWDGEFFVQIPPRMNGMCTRTIAPAFADKYIQVNALWELDNGTFEELELIGKDLKGVVNYWTFSSDGKFSNGQLIDANDVIPGAVGFEAPSASGKVRAPYWPEENGFGWAVETQTGGE